ncbi:uncharacterized protein LOC125179120 [Hyalella azteca]|uniref:Uncharacterized protein LOC125179120 n=1 Tax=Hyalella azteca TaxID=294128 RepID=A0A979FUQ0_HYAAZ|nr:uncharacterized protein LOC125179120 [Hyalella azteca]
MRSLALVRLLALGAMLQARARGWASTLQNYVIVTPVYNTVHVRSQCACEAQCRTNDTCTAVTYDAVSDVCFLSNATGSSLTTRHLLEAVTYTKFSYVPAPTDMFLASTWSKNGTRANQVKICAEENGIPLIIRTTSELETAKQLIDAYGHFGVFGNYAFMSARDEEGNRDLMWPDGTKVFGSVFSPASMTGGSGPAMVLKANGQVEPNLDEKE